MPSNRRALSTSTSSLASPPSPSPGSPPPTGLQLDSQASFRRQPAAEREEERERFRWGVTDRGILMWRRRRGVELWGSTMEGDTEDRESITAAASAMNIVFSGEIGGERKKERRI
uniref:Uncharacterized protein n=1 Tax=Opuntia streptacantha TaxID=393608 RepID=A0A7C8Z7Z0_OPUST